MIIRRTFDIIDFQQHRYPNERALVSYNAGQQTAYSTQQCREQINRNASALIDLGIGQGDRVVIVPQLASVSWLWLDLAIQSIGAIVVPVHYTSQPAQLYHILGHTETKWCFMADQAIAAYFLPLPEALSEIDIYYLHEDDAQSKSWHYQLNHTELKPELIAERSRQVQEEDLAAIIYTSGTTGIPKGVMLSHHNLMSNLHSVMPLVPLNRQKVSLSFLPFSHIFERTAIYVTIATGCSLYLLTDREELAGALRDIRPHFFTAVPRIIEKMYEQLLSLRAGQSRWQRMLIDWALGIGQRYRERPGLSLGYWLQLHLARLLVFNRLRRSLGGRVEGIIVGAAHLQPHLGRLLGAMGIRIREGYGMTETSPVVSLNQFRPGMFSYGTVGIPIPGVEVRIDAPDEAGEGEILVRGPNVTRGYYRQPELTQEVLDENGWLHTGDVGKFVKRRFLQITDRKKDIFKTSAGKYIAPQVLENHFKQTPYIEQIMIVGFQRPYLTAVIRPNFDLLERWCLENDIHWTTPQYMVLNIKVREKMQTEIDQLNAALPNFQTIRNFHLTHTEWTIQSGMLTYTLKLIRPQILATYQKEIDQLYRIG